LGTLDGRTVIVTGGAAASAPRSRAGSPRRAPRWSSTTGSSGYRRRPEGRRPAV